MDKKDALKKAYELGAEYEARATNCCQSTIAAIQDAIGCRNNDVFRAGSPFAGGLGFCHRGICGALTGATMVIGQLYGRSRDEFDIDSKREIDDKDFNYVTATKGWELAYELYELFLIHYESPICFDVSKKVIGRSEVEFFLRPDSPARSKIGSNIRKISPHSKEGCGSVVANASKWATEIILRQGISENM